MADAGSWRTKLAGSFKTGCIVEDLKYTYHGFILSDFAT